MPHDNTHWMPELFEESPIIQQLNSYTSHFQNFSGWPSIDDYQKLFKQYHSKIKPVKQSLNISCLEDQYEPRVFLKQELQTRIHNWHDFFNAMIWLKFPKTKSQLNKHHYHSVLQRPPGSNRSLIENKITQFDECGALLICNSEETYQLIKTHQWKQLFLTQTKQQLASSLQCIIFGHAIFEKAVQPYIGMTCHCILVNDNTLFQDAAQQNTTRLDEYLASRWETGLLSIPKRFQPLPILGLPGYWPEQDSQFYENTDYFRPYS